MSNGGDEGMELLVRVYCVIGPVLALMLLLTILLTEWVTK